MPDDYVTVRVPSSLRDLYERLNENYGLGYTSFAEFVKEAMRKRFEDIENTYGDRTKDP